MQRRERRIVMSLMSKMEKWEGNLRINEAVLML
jgi:hypothetical protein